MDNATDTNEIMTIEQAAETLLPPAEEEVVTEEGLADTEDDAADDVGDEEFDGEGEEPEAVEEDDDEPEEVEASQETETFTVKVDGEDVSVTREELTRSYSGQKYILKGMKEVAQQKREAEGVYHALQQEQARVAQLYETMSKQGVVQAPQAPDPSTAQDDPVGYIQALAEYNSKLDAFKQQEAEVQATLQQQSAAAEKATQAYMQEQRQKLMQDIPELADATKGKQLLSEMRATGERYGFSASELDQISDSRTVKVLHDAYQWRKFQESKGSIEQKVKKARPAVKPKAPGKASAETKRQRELKSNLKRTGRIEDAAQLLMTRK